MKVIDERETKMKKTKQTNKQTNKQKQKRIRGDRSYSEKVRAK